MYLSICLHVEVIFVDNIRFFIYKMFKGKTMKKILFIISVLIMLIISPACKYNREATVFVTNTGELTAAIKIEHAQSTLKPGEREKFEITWPATDKMNLNLSSFATAYPEKLWKNVNFWISKDEVKYMEVAYYRPKKSGSTSID